MYMIFVIFQYCAEYSKECVLEYAASVGSIYDYDQAMTHSREYLFGLYNYVMGFNARMKMKHQFEYCDKINSKSHPEKVVGEKFNQIYSGH